jgi:hypothetical protein
MDGMLALLMLPVVEKKPQFTASCPAKVRKDTNDQSRCKSLVNQEKYINTQSKWSDAAVPRAMLVLPSTAHGCRSRFTRLEPTPHLSSQVEVCFFFNQLTRSRRYIFSDHLAPYSALSPFAANQKKKSLCYHRSCVDLKMPRISCPRGLDPLQNAIGRDPSTPATASATCHLFQTCVAWNGEKVWPFLDSAFFGTCSVYGQISLQFSLMEMLRLHFIRHIDRDASFGSGQH